MNADRRAALTTKAKLAGRIAELAGHVAVERLGRRGPAGASGIPRSADAFTPEWLTGALCGRHAGARVVSFEVVGGSNGTTSRRTIDVTYDDAGREAGLPARVFTKATPNLTTRLVVGPTGALATEVGFYNDLRPLLDVETPASYLAVMEPRSCRSMLLLEDVSATRGARFGDPVSLPVDQTMAEQMVTTLATYHAAYWNSSRLRRLPWLRSALDWQRNVNLMLPFERRSLIGFDRAEQVIPPELRPLRSQIYPAFMRSLEINSRAPETLLHSDMHLGNWYVTDTAMGIYDWQCATRGQWALDLAYALGSALAIKDRRAWELDLLELYLDRLAAGGVQEPPTIGDAFLAYRQQIFHGLAFWLFTLGASRMQPKMQPEHISMANIERMAAAVVDNESLEACAAA